MPVLIRSRNERATTVSSAASVVKFCLIASMIDVYPHGCPQFKSVPALRPAAALWTHFGLLPVVRAAQFVSIRASGPGIDNPPLRAAM